MPADVKIFVYNNLYGKNIADKFVNYAADVRDVTAYNIKAFNQTHFLLFSSCNLISKYFSLQILLYILATAFQGITTVLVVFNPVVTNSSIKVPFLMFVGCNYLFVFCIARTLNEIKSEVRKLRRSVHVSVCLN